MRFRRLCISIWEFLKWKRNIYFFVILPSLKILAAHMRQIQRAITEIIFLHHKPNKEQLSFIIITYILNKFTSTTLTNMKPIRLNTCNIVK